MSRITVYREWYEQEKASNRKMLEMIDSAPADSRSDPRFERALVLAAHLAACRENWLDRMTGGTAQADWWPSCPHFEELAPRYTALEERWTRYLDGLEDEDLNVDFDFPVGQGGSYRWNIEGQIRQLIGHSFYHRGQIALLVEQLGGKPVDTDYLYWAFEQQPERWKKLAQGSHD